MYLRTIERFEVDNRIAERQHDVSYESLMCIVWCVGVVY